MNKIMGAIYCDPCCKSNYDAEKQYTMNFKFSTDNG